TAVPERGAAPAHVEDERGQEDREADQPTNGESAFLPTTLITAATTSARISQARRAFAFMQAVSRPPRAPRRPRSARDRRRRSRRAPPRRGRSAAGTRAAGARPQ